MSYSTKDATKEVFWSREETLALIAEYKKYPILYDTAHPSYTKISHKNDAVLKIKDKLISQKPDLDENSIKRKLKGLRQQLSREKKFWDKKSGSTKFRPRLWCFKQLSFIRDANAIYQPNQTKLPQATSNSIDEFSDLVDTQSFIEDELIEETYSDYIEDETQHFKSNADNNQLAHVIDKCNTREEAFCDYLCLELNALKNEETFDKLKFKIIKLVLDAKAEERLMDPPNWRPAISTD